MVYAKITYRKMYFEIMCICILHVLGEKHGHWKVLVAFVATMYSEAANMYSNDLLTGDLNNHACRKFHKLDFDENMQK